MIREVYTYLLFLKNDIHVYHALCKHMFTCVKEAWVYQAPTDVYHAL